MDNEEKLRMYRGEYELVIATDPVDAKLVIHDECGVDLDEIDDHFEEIDPAEEIQVAYPDGIVFMREEFEFLPESGIVTVKAKVADWIARHGRGVLSSENW